ncbi:MAG: DUF1549 and DUF1553 domain-containing protein, partial [Verrucomicrobiota bacterium]
MDRFILAGLEEHRLAPAPVAEPATLLRRLALDLTGLPPTPEQVDAFGRDQRPDAWERAVEEWLGSPAHGERWAQHWLDQVRYADTHGFEVNTERPHAWPYRDYVIRAFNHDLPYDRFIREQLAGDALGEDAATGFLVTAAALLPGQIGADDASKRLARQDMLSEIVAGTGETFLGLTLGCARCHDHKFDPVPQQDFYALQAFFAGVEHGDRPRRTPEAEARRREAEALKPRLGELDRLLSGYEPLARPDAPPPRETRADRNVESFPALEARFIRFTIHDANRHPTLGLIEPCLDEFEIFTAGEAPRNVALASAGTRVTASGSRTSELHQLEHVHDGVPGNRRSWMSDEPGAGWVQFELPVATRIDQVVWSRDREGKFTDRLPTAYTLEAGRTPESLTRLVHVPPRRPAVHPRLAVDRFAPVRAAGVRFTVLACTSLEPCLDELEVFTTGDSPRNVALAANGTRARASGTIAGSDQHRLEHLHDGRPGNSRSWISSETGRGWVELEFPQPEEIDRVIWSRDREGQFADRMPTRYRVEVKDSAGVWRVVADSSDRHPDSPGGALPSRLSVAGLDPTRAREARTLLDQRQQLAERLAGLEAGPLVYGGIFRAPDETRRLHRGDPEQPRERVAPAIPPALGSLRLPPEAAEQERRLALAGWIIHGGQALAARVMANRVWQGHFGIGLVETPSDFGTQGALPSHPELLDWLALELIRSGWSLKHLHRLILHSATYRQSGRIDPQARALDAQDRRLGRFPRRRLEAEAVRDSMLAASGRLHRAAGGPGFNLFQSRGGLNGFPPVEAFDADGSRRLVYAHKVRMERDIVFGAFDCPDAGQSTPRRRPSTTPLQALNLFNSR